MPRAARTCARCPTVIPNGERLCLPCLTAQRAASDRARRPDGNPYATHGHHTFRTAVLARDPICVLCHRRWSTVADHHPISRRDIEAAGLNPDDPNHGRGLCKRCHDRETARNQPGGWNARNGGG